MRLIGAFLGFWYDFIVGDDWRIAAGVLAVVALAALAARAGVDASVITVGVAVCVIALTFASILGEARRGRA